MEWEQFTVRITGIRQEAADVKTFTLERIDRAPIAYTAGQFLTFLFYHHKEERRSFSISSSPFTGEPLSITVKRIENGAYSRYLTDRAATGDELRTTGAGGLFTFPADVYNRKQLFFFAAGIGITPVFSLIKTALAIYPSHQLTLIYSNRNREEVVFFNELEILKQSYPERFDVEYLFSNSFDLSRARLSKWLLPILISEHRKAEDSELLFFLCGPFTYMRMILITLEEMGYAETQIKKENFNTLERPVKKPEPPDKATHNVHVSFANKQYELTVSYPETILQAAKKNNIALPYSCEVGRCGSCVAICKSGNIWMSYNEVLTDADIASGKILTCVGHPINGDASIAL